MFSPYDYYITPEEYEEAARNGLTRQQVNDRVRKLGWPKNKAIKLPLQVIYRVRPDVYVLAKAHGITSNQIHNRLRLGWDEKKAATTPLEKLSDKIERFRLLGKRNRKYPLEIVELAARNGISIGTFHKRMSKGWDCTRAATIPPSPRNAVMRLKEKYGENYFRDMANKMWANRKNRIK